MNEQVERGHAVEAAAMAYVDAAWSPDISREMRDAMAFSTLTHAVAHLPDEAFNEVIDRLRRMTQLHRDLEQRFQAMEDDQ